MRRKSTAFRLWAVAVFLFATVFNTPTGMCADYIFVPDQTNVRFSWQYFGISRQTGTLNDVAGQVSYDPGKPRDTSIEVTLMVASLKTGHGFLDHMLTKSGDFFDAKHYPKMVFKSTRILMTGDKAYIAGYLTINGITKPVTLRGELDHADGRTPTDGLGVSLRGRIKRSKWNVGTSNSIVSDMIEITIKANMRPKQ